MLTDVKSIVAVQYLDYAKDTNVTLTLRQHWFHYSHINVKLTQHEDLMYLMPINLVIKTPSTRNSWSGGELKMKETSSTITARKQDGREDKQRSGLSPSSPSQSTPLVRLADNPEQQRSPSAPAFAAT